MELENEEGLEQEEVEQSLVSDDREKVYSFYQKKGDHGRADGQEPAGGVGQECAQGEELFGGERESRVCEQNNGGAAGQDGGGGDCGIIYFLIN